MQIPKGEVLSKRIIGKKGDSNVWLVRTVGGLNLICIETPGKAEIASLASHPAMAEFLAQQKDPSIQYNSLRKSILTFNAQDPVFKKYSDLTATLQNLQKK